MEVGIIAVIKIVTTVFFLISFIYSIKTFFLTRHKSAVWFFITLALGTAVILSFVRTIKEFIPMAEFEIIKIQLIPLVIAFFFAASCTLRREKELP